MADRIRFAVSAVPIETITDENGVAHDILASEINRSLSSGGESLSLANYSGSAGNQGYSNTIVNYKSASYSAGGSEVSSTIPDFIFIRNTGHIYSSATVLGEVSTDCVIVALRIEQAGIGGAGGWINSLDVSTVHYIEIAWLQPSQAILLPLGCNNKSISQFGSTPYDLTPFDFGAGGNVDQGDISLYVKTVQSNGVTATSANAIEFLAVT